MEKPTQKPTGFENMSNTELIDAFVSRYESEGTRSVYRAELLKFDRLLGKPFKDMSKLDLLDYSQLITTTSKSTRQRIYATVRSLFKWLVWAGVVWEQDDPAKGTFRKVKPVANVAAKCLLQSEVEKMYEVAYPDARDYAMIMVLSTTGVRINEMVKMKWSEMFQSVDENTKKLEWYISVIGKGGKLRDCWIREDAAIALVRLNGREIDTTREGYIFTSFYRQVYGKMSVDGARKAIKDIADRAGIKEEFTPHWFRHTFGTLTANNGAPVRELQANMGHAELKTTEKYLWSQNTKVAKYYPATFTPTEDRKRI